MLNLIKTEKEFLWTFSQALFNIFKNIFGDASLFQINSLRESKKYFTEEYVFAATEGEIVVINIES